MGTLNEAVSEFGKEAKASLSAVAASGQPEDQLRTPFVGLLKALAPEAGIDADKLSIVGESAVASLGTRPDYAVGVSDVLIGHVELKAPGKGADPREFKDKHDKAQWKRLQQLPNLIYSDGNAFSLWRDGKPVLDPPIVELSGSIKSAGAKLSAPPELASLFAGFLQWKPVAPENDRQLAEVTARLCRLLRDTVAEEIEGKNQALIDLRDEWATLLFPEEGDWTFANSYAQAVAFGLLIARVRKIPLDQRLDRVVLDLIDTDSLIGSALRLLVDNKDVRSALATGLEPMQRVLATVDWSKITGDDPDAWLLFYEHFLQVYDKDLRKKTGSYYTPPDVVAAMIRLTDQALADPAHFSGVTGIADDKVRVCDPATGTGTFMLGVLRHVAETAKPDGKGRVASELTALADRLFGFELQFGPFAVAELRLLAEIKTLTDADVPAPKVYLTDTLANPYEELETLPAMAAEIGRSRRAAYKIKREEPITVVIGNPPYKDEAAGNGGWIEKGRSGAGTATPMDGWTPPREWGVDAHKRHLKNMHVFFWRWAAMKVFGSGWQKATGEEPSGTSGAVCYITTSAFLAGQGFVKMREDLRRQCSSIYVIDCTPEGHQGPVKNRIFPTVQQPICIVLAIRSPNADTSTPAIVRFQELPIGPRETTKFPHLRALDLHAGWEEIEGDWTDPFLPPGAAEWVSNPLLAQVFDYSGTGVMAGRTWPIAPDVQSLEMRWKKLIEEPKPKRKETLFFPHLRKGKPGDRHAAKKPTKRLGTLPQSALAISAETNTNVRTEPYAFRSFDRQHVIADIRVINQQNPQLWDWHSAEQIYLTAQEDRAPQNGPAVTLTAMIPDVHHYAGRGGRVYPLWKDANATQPNVRPTLIKFLSGELGAKIEPADVMAYLAATLAHPGYLARFGDELRRPGLRAVLTSDAALFDEAVRLGRQIVWLHTFGARMIDPSATPPRPGKAPRMAANAPTIPVPISQKEDQLPDRLVHDPKTDRLIVGDGHVENVTTRMYDYRVSSDTRVIDQWFSYRRRNRAKERPAGNRKPSPLSAMHPKKWLPAYERELIELLNVLGCLIGLEDDQADLFDRILAGPTFDTDELFDAGAIPAPVGVQDDEADDED